MAPGRLYAEVCCWVHPPARDRRSSATSTGCSVVAGRSSTLAARAARSSEKSPRAAARAASRFAATRACASTSSASARTAWLCRDAREAAVARGERGAAPLSGCELRNFRILAKRPSSASRLLRRAAKPAWASASASREACVKPRPPAHAMARTSHEAAFSASKISCKLNPGPAACWACRRSRALRVPAAGSAPCPMARVWEATMALWDATASPTSLARSLPGACMSTSFTAA